MTAAQLNQQIRDNENALLGGLVGTGFTLFDLIGTGTVPAVAIASHATMYYDTTIKSLRASLTGGAYFEIGGVQTSFLFWAGLVL